MAQGFSALDIATQALIAVYVGQGMQHKATDIVKRTLQVPLQSPVSLTSFAEDLVHSLNEHVRVRPCVYFHVCASCCYCSYFVLYVEARLLLAT